MNVSGTASQLRPILQNIGSPAVVFYAVDPSGNVQDVVAPSAFPGVRFRFLDAYTTTQMSSDMGSTFYRQVTEFSP